MNGSYHPPISDASGPDAPSPGSSLRETATWPWSRSIEDAISYPTRGEDGLERLLIGGVLVPLSMFVLPMFLVYGYLVRCLAAVAVGEETPPLDE